MKHKNLFVLNMYIERIVCMYIELNEKQRFNLRLSLLRQGVPIKVNIIINPLYH